MDNEHGQRTVLDSLFELWINNDPVYGERVRELYGELGEWMENMSMEESERLNGIIVDLCVAYARGAFLDGARLGGALVHEILFGEQITH